MTGGYPVSARSVSSTRSVAQCREPSLDGVAGDERGSSAEYGRSSRLSCTELGEHTEDIPGAFYLWNLEG